MVDAPLATLDHAPDSPPLEECRELLEILRDLCSGDSTPFVRAPVRADSSAFPEPFEPTPAGIATTLRRLAWHAGLRATPALTDRRADAAPSARRATTEVELVAIAGGRARFDLYAIGDDDVAGTLAHEIGVAAALELGTRDAPFRAAAEVAPGPADLRRGSVAAVHVGLGVLAANAAFQEYTGGVYQPTLGYAPLEHDIIRAGHLPMDALAFLLAVQAEARGAELPPGLGRPQTDVAHAWRAALAGRGPELRAFLGLGEPATWTDLDRPPPEPLPDPDVVTVASSGRAPRAYRVRYSHAGTFGILGLAAGGVGAVAAGAGVPSMLLAVTGGLLAGYLLGRSRVVYRCSDCLTVLTAAERCDHCGKRIAGEIASRAERLDADDEEDEPR